MGFEQKKIDPANESGWLRVFIGTIVIGTNLEKILGQLLQEISSMTIDGPVLFDPVCGNRVWS